MDLYLERLTKCRQLRLFYARDVSSCTHILVWSTGTELVEMAAVSCTWHQPCQRCKYTTFGGDSENALDTRIEQHESAVSLLESGERRYINAVIIIMLSTITF